MFGSLVPLAFVWFFICASHAFSPSLSSCRNAAPTVRLLAHSSTAIHAGRRAALQGMLGIAGFWVFAPKVVKADVSDGNALPQGAAQFSRVLRLKNDLKGVRTRVAASSSEIDKREWDNIGQFLRAAYSVGDDMKAVASGIGDPDNKKRATDDIELLRKYAQAGDVSVSRQDASGFVAIAEKMSGLVDDFLDSLSDVPDEI